MIIKRIVLVAILIVIAWALTAYKDRVPKQILDIGAQNETATTSSQNGVE